MPDLFSWIDQRINAALQAAETILPNLQKALQGARLEVPDDLEVSANGLVYVPGKARLDYLWFEVIEREGGKTYHEYRAMRLMHLASIPLNARSDQGALAKMRTVLRGLYNAKVDIVYLVAGIYHPEQLGIVQCYGAVGRGETREEAAAQAIHGAASLEAAMAAAYPQVHFHPLGVDVSEWISKALMKMPYSVLTIGHPDPRENARGGQSDLNPLLASGKHGIQEFTLQQNELVMRGMAQLEEDFLLQVLLTPVSMQAASRMLAGLAEYTSTWAAWQTGSRSFNIGASLPLMLSGALARNAGTGYTESQSAGQADGVSHVASQSHTDGQAHSHTEGLAVSDGISNTHTARVVCHRKPFCFRRPVGGKQCLAVSRGRLERGRVGRGAGRGERQRRIQRLFERVAGHIRFDLEHGHGRDGGHPLGERLADAVPFRDEKPVRYQHHLPG